MSLTILIGKGLRIQPFPDDRAVRCPQVFAKWLVLSLYINLDLPLTLLGQSS